MESYVFKLKTYEMKTETCMKIVKENLNKF